LFFFDLNTDDSTINIVIHYYYINFITKFYCY